LVPGFKRIRHVFCGRRAHERSSQNGRLIASDKEKAAYLLNDLDALQNNDRALFFPESYRQPYQIEKTTNANIQERAEVLNLLSKESFNGVVVTYPHALCEKVTLKKTAAPEHAADKKRRKAVHWFYFRVFVVV